MSKLSKEAKEILKTRPITLEEIKRFKQALALVSSLKLPVIP